MHAAPLSVTTASFSNGTVGAAFSATLAATGGTGSYSWSIVSGSLPSGLTLNLATGVISGTLTAAATSNFTVQVADSASPPATSSMALSITVAATPTTVTIQPSTVVPGLVDGGTDSSVELGVKFRSDVAGSITGIRFYKASANAGTLVGNLWSSTGTKLATVTFTNETSRTRLARVGSRCYSQARWRLRPTRCTWPRTTPTAGITALMSATSLAMRRG